MKRISDADLSHILRHTGDTINALRNKSVFITGATGFFGKWLLESFLFLNKELSLNASICALSRNPEAFLQAYPFYRDESSVTFIKGDVQDFIFPEGDFQYVIHAATDADAKINSESPLLMLDTITKGTRRVLDFAKTQHLDAFLMTSSGAIYGKQPPEISNVSEEQGFLIDINAASSAYAEGKRMAELYASTYHATYNIPVKIARCFAFVGPYLPLDKHFAIGNFILNGLNHQDIVIKGDGTPYRSYMYAADLMIWMWTILIKGDMNVPYNVGSGVPVSIKETAELVAANFDSVDYKVLKPQSGMPAERYVPDIDRALQQLNLEIHIDLQDAIARTIMFYSDQKI